MVSIILSVAYFFEKKKIHWVLVGNEAPTTPYGLVENGAIWPSASRTSKDGNFDSHPFVGRRVVGIRRYS